MKILIFLPGYYILNNEGGNIVHVKELIEHLSKQAEIHIVADDKNRELHTPIIYGFFSMMQGFFRGISIIFKEGPEIIYTREDRAIFAFVLAKLFKLPLIIEVNDLLLDQLKLTERYRNRKIRKWISYILCGIDERTYKHADHIIAVTDNLKKVLQKEHGINSNKITVIKNGANTGLFRPMDQKEARKELNLDQDANYVCFVGSLAPWQGVEFLIQSAPSILKKFPNTKFLIVGDGLMKEGWMNLADKTGVSDNFIFTGSVPYEEVPKYINSSDVCVSLDTSCAIVGQSKLKVSEYMACGKAVIGCDSGYEIIDEYKTGILVNPEDKTEVSNAIIKLLRDDKLRREMGANGRRLVVENYSWESVAKKVAKVCEDVIR